jgi:hypothetical protein
MSLPEQTAAFQDCYDLFERAQNSTKGIRIPVADERAARYLRLRLNHARVLERREAQKLYERHDPRHNKSINDKFRVTYLPTVEGDGYWVYIEPWCADNYEGVEEIE